MSSSINNNKRKIAIFDIDDTLIHFDYKKPRDKKNYQPIKPNIDKLKKAIADPNTLTMVITNSPHRHVHNVLPKLGLDAKTYFHRRDENHNFLPSGRLEIKHDLDKHGLVDCAFGIDNKICDNAIKKGIKFYKDGNINYERKPQIYQLRDALKNLQNAGAFDPQKIAKVTVWGDLSHTDGMLARGVHEHSMQLFGKPIKVKYRAVDPYKSDSVRDYERSAANYKTKKPLPNFGEEKFGRPQATTT